MLLCFSLSFKYNRNNFILKMNILQFQQDPDNSFEEQESQRFSIEQETEDLINEVFNQKYNPSLFAEKYKFSEKQKRKANQFNQPKRNSKANPCLLKIYQNIQDNTNSPSFQQFLRRAQQRIDKQSQWLLKQRDIKNKSEVSQMKEIPQILRGSREKITPIYQRCINLQKSKEKNLEFKRIEKYRKQIESAQNFTYKPSINPNQHKNRTFEEYLTEQLLWQEKRQESLQKKRLTCQARKYAECTFVPKLVSKYAKPNSRIISGERVQDRLLRSLQKSAQKDQKNIKKTRV